MRRFKNFKRQLSLLKCEHLRVLGTKAKSQIDEHIDKTGSEAAEFMTDLETQTQQLQELETQVGVALSNTTSLPELVNILHTNSGQLDAITLPNEDALRIQPKSVKFFGKQYVFSRP